MNYSTSIEELNDLNRAEFVELLGKIFEETPAIAERVWRDRPFQSITDLHQKMTAIVSQMTQDEQLALIRAHPELGSRATMAEASVQEQAGAGLGQLTAAERQQIEDLNRAYRRKFEFPFVMAIKGYGKAEILTAFEARLENDKEVEKARSLLEISKIARLRLEALTSD